MAAVWPARTWTPAEKATALMMNGVRDQLNELHNQVVIAAAGWTDVPFNVANFWPGVASAQVNVNRYVIQGKVMTWMMQIANVSTAPSPAGSYIYLTLPAGALVNVLSPTAVVLDNGLFSSGLVLTGNPGVVAVQKNTGAYWTGPNIYVYFTAIIHLQ